MINSISADQFKFNEKGELVIDNTKSINKGGSSIYSSKLNNAINNTERTITIKIGTSYIDKDGNTKSVDDAAGGGVTITAGKPASIVSLDDRPSVASDPTIIVSGNENYKLGVLDTPELILMHELVGHAIPIIVRKMNGNAVENENEIRDQLSIERRPADPDHLESSFGKNQDMEVKENVKDND